MSIRKQGPNTWQIAVHLGKDEAGKQIRRYHTFYGSRREAVKEDARLQYERDQGTYVDPSRLTVAEYLDRWLKDFARLTTSPRTFQGYSDVVRLHIAPGLGDILLMKLRPIHIQQFYADQLEHGRHGKEHSSLSAQTVRNMHNILHQALGTAVKCSPSIRPMPYPHPG